jgi:chromosome segregation ATPase
LHRAAFAAIIVAMKSLLLWCVTVLALVAAALFYIANKSRSEELAKLQPQIQQLESLRAEIAGLKTNQVPAEELGRLRKNAEELLRLRNEVRQLRDKEKQLTQQVQSAQTAAQRAQEQVAAVRTQAQTAQAQAQAQLQALVAATNAATALTPEQQAQKLFAERYGIAPIPAGQQANACINKLRQLDGAKQQWALENRKTAEATPSVQEVTAYLKDGFPKCPAGGVYSLNAVQAHPTCSAQGHALPQ